MAYKKQTGTVYSSDPFLKYPLNPRVYPKPLLLFSIQKTLVSLYKEMTTEGYKSLSLPGKKWTSKRMHYKKKQKKKFFPLSKKQTKKNQFNLVDISASETDWPPSKYINFWNPVDFSRDFLFLSRANSIIWQVQNYHLNWMHLVGAKQNADVDRRENREIDMKETGKASMLECQKCSKETGKWNVTWKWKST